MKTVNVILTSAGSQVAPGLIGMMRQSRRYRLRVIGTDAGDSGMLVGLKFCDAFYKVPYGVDRRYISAMKKICKKEKVSVIFPASDEEALVLAGKSYLFSDINTSIACAAAPVIKQSLDKLELMSALRMNGISVGEFYGLDRVGDISKYAKRLGYPSNNVVLKPRTARGARGLRILTSSFDAYDAFYKNDSCFSSLKEIERIFSRNPCEIEKFLMMEYFHDAGYSVDILAERGRPVASVCRKKLYPIGSPTQVADMICDKDVIAYAEKVISFMGFDFFAQVEVGLNKLRQPCLVEINPRIDATLPIVEGRGLNYFEEMIHYALTGGFLLNKRAVKKTPARFYRYWQHIFARG